MESGPRPVDRDLLELMVAYGFLGADAVAGGSLAAPIREAPTPTRTPGLAPLRLALIAAAPEAGRTTVATGLAAAWARAGRSVLLVDLDPSDELARRLLFGSAITVDTGQLLLRAVVDDGIAEPSHTLIPGVDVLANGGMAFEPEPYLARLRARPTALREALAPWLDRYDRIVVDVPNAPAALRVASRAITDAVLTLVPAAAAGALPVPLSFDRKRLAVALTRFGRGAPPPPEAVAALAALGLLDTAVPELPGLRDAWDVVAGTAGTTADAVFDRLATDLDALRPVPRPTPRPLGASPPPRLRFTRRMTA